MAKEKKLPVIEIFGPTIQGEGCIAGQRTHFIRFGGCPRRCEWCDSMHAVDPAEIKRNATYMTAKEIVDHVCSIEKIHTDTPWVTISGGDPLMWDLKDVVAGLIYHGFLVAVETQGDLYRPWIHDIDLLTVSPKPPSAGPQDGPPKYATIDEYFRSSGPEKIAFKVVVFDEADLDFAVEIKRHYPTETLFLSIGTDVLSNLSGDDLILDTCHRYRWLINKALERPELKGASIFPQLHVLAWAEAQGV